MRLHTQGFKLPSLGSVQDRIIREYLTKEAMLEAKRTEFQMLTLLTNPQISDDNKWRTWKKQVGNVWDGYIGLLMNTEVKPDEVSDEDKKLTEFYENVVKKSKLTMRRDKKTGELVLEGVNTLLPG